MSIASSSITTITNGSAGVGVWERVWPAILCARASIAVTASSRSTTAAPSVVAWRVNRREPRACSTPPFRSMPWTWTRPVLMAGARFTSSIHMADAFPDPDAPAVRVWTWTGWCHGCPSSVTPISAVVIVGARFGEGNRGVQHRRERVSEQEPDRAAGVRRGSG